MHKLPPRDAPALGETTPSNPEPDAVLGCGWFDSSHDLQRGLLVHEHASLAEVADLLPLASWLALHLSGWRPQA